MGAGLFTKGDGNPIPKIYIFFFKSLNSLTHLWEFLWKFICPHKLRPFAGQLSDPGYLDLRAGLLQFIRSHLSLIAEGTVELKHEITISSQDHLFDL